jgi:hypothetical protein
MPQQPVLWNGLDSHGQPLTWGSPEFVWNGTIPSPTPTPQKHMPQQRVLLGFSDASDHDLEELTGAVLNGLYGNPAFTTPPVLKPALQTALTNFTDGIAAQANGGPAATAHKNNMRAALISLLRILAAYVQLTANNDLAVLLSSGFDAVSTNRAQQPLATPTITDIENGMTTYLIVKVDVVKNARNYETRFALAPAGQPQGPWQDGGLNSKARNMPIGPLVPGQNYVFQVRARGGSTGASDWSNPVGHMCM